MATDDRPAGEGISRRSLLRSGLLAGAAVATTGATSTLLTGRAMASTPNPQSGWAYCAQCSVLYWHADQSESACPNNPPTDTHVTHTGYSNYSLFNSLAGLTNSSNPQPGWTWCSKCQGLWHSRSGSACWANKDPLQSTIGPHTVGSGTSYDLDWTRVVGPPLTGTNPQPNWFWCQYCHLLFYDGDGLGIAGICPRNGAGGHENIYGPDQTNYSLPTFSKW